MVTFFFRLAFSVVLWGGRNTTNCVHSDSATLDLPRSWCVCFPSLHWSDSRLLCWELSDAGPGLHALPRSKSLRFRFSGTPQRHRLVWTCILHPCQVQAVQVTRSLVHVVTLERCDLSPPLSQLPLWGHDCPLLALAALACLSLVGDGPVCSQLALLSPLFCDCAWWWLGLFAGSQDSYPTVWVAISS